LVATCNAGGANKWPEALNPHFRGRTVFILPDNDDAGRSHAQRIAAALHGIAADVRIVAVPDLPPGGDVSDWLDGGGDAATLLELCRAAPPWRPENGAHGAAVLTPYCEEALTLAFSERHAEDLRYCKAFGRWFEWRAGYWREDIKRNVFTHARRLCRETSVGILADSGGENAAAKIATSVASARTVAAVVNLARADARHATAPEDWDADPWALNTPAGLVDLRSGRLLPHGRRCARRSPRSHPPKPIARAGSDSSTK
jgi:putative DNA primase/helicase